MASFDLINKQMNEKYGRKKEEEQKQTAPQTPGSRKVVYDYTAGKMESRYDPSVGLNEYDVRSFLADSGGFIRGYEHDTKNMGYTTASDIYSSRNKTWTDLTARGNEIYDYLSKNPGMMDEEGLAAFQDYLKNFRKAAVSQNWNLYQAQKYYGQWETEDDYNAYLTQQQTYEDQKNLDLKASEKEIAGLESMLREYQSLSRWMTDEKGQARLEELRQQYGGEEDIKALIAQKKQYMNQARHIQDGLALSGVAGNGDFGQYSGYKSTRRENPAWWQSDVGDTQYEWINNRDGFRDQYEQENERNMALAALADQSSIPLDPGESEYKQKGYDRLTEQEIGIYNYYYAKEGKEKAQAYLDSIQESLNRRQAEEIFSGLEGNTALELLFGVNAGLDQFKSGMFSLINTEDDYIDQSVYQIASGMVREDLADNGPKILGNSLGQVGYDAITTTANMVPSIITSMGMNIIAPGSGAVVGTAMMGASAAGNAYQEMLNMGYDKSQARAYSALVGGSEAGLQYLLGGIGKLGGKVTGQALTKILNGVDNAFARVAIKLGGNMLSEGVEEGLQEILTPWFQNLIMHTDEKVNWSEVAYSTLLGSLTAGIMEGGGTVSGEVGNYQQGRQLQQSGVTAQRLAEVGKTFSADTVAYQLAGRVNENTGAYTLGRLFGEIGAEVTAQNQADIQNSLMEKGLPEQIAGKNAEVFAQVVAGGQFTEAQIAVIEANEVLAQTVAEVIIDPNSTVNQRTQGYNEMLMALAQEKTAPDASRMNPAAPGQENADTADTVDTAEESGSEGGAKAMSIASIQNRQATVKLEDGSEVGLNEANLDPDEAARIETIAGIDGISREDANFILATLRTAPASRFDALGAKEAYRYGFYGVSEDHVAKHGAFANSLNESQRKAIYNAGRTASAAQTAAKQAVVAKNAATVAKNATTGKVHFDGNREALTKRQSASLSALEKVADALGVQIHVFESQVGANGKHIGANGWYDGKEIHIDLHAGENGEGTMLFTAAHELTHHIRAWSPEKFKTLADFLMQEYGKKGVNVEGLIREQMNKAKRAGRTISYDTAYEEVVADSMETMLADGRVLEKLTRLKQKDLSLWQKIKDYISELASKIRQVYEGMTADSVEGRYVADMKDAIEKLQDLFVEGLVDASENFRAEISPGEEGVSVNQHGDPVAYATEDGSVLLSMRTYEEDGRKAFRDYLQKCVKNESLTKAEMQEMLNGIEEIYGICKDFKDKYAPFSSWSDAAVVRDTHGRPVFSVVTPNGDYKMNLDFSLVCKKRRTLDAVFNEMSRRGIIDDFELGQKSVVKINEIIRKYGLETACALCFVDAKRFRQASMADSFTSLYNELVESLVPEDQKGSIDHFNFSGYETIKKVDGGIDTWPASKLDFSHLDHVMKTYGKGTVEHKAAKYIKTHAQGRKLLLRGDFMSSQGFDAVKTRNKDILKLYNSKKGTGGPKAAFGDVQYMNEIIKKARTWTPDKAYAVGGVRIQSFSDYVPRMVFDYAQMIYDLAATKLPAHAYTKEALFVKQFGLTGVKINMSLIPAIAEGGIAPGLDAKGNYVWAGESFDFDTAKQIQNAEGYTENCGTICVGVSQAHIEKLLADPDIRMVIPYHKSGLNPIVAHMNKIAAFTDYTDNQRTKGRDGKAIEQDFDFSKAMHDMGEKADPKAVADQYLKWCASHDYRPRFHMFAHLDGYYKLLEDFTLYDKDGRYVPQREVRAVFPKEGAAFGSMKDLIREGLEEDAVVEGKRDRNLSKIVDEIQKTLPRTEAEIEEKQVQQADRDLEAEVKYSDRDSEGNRLSAEQQEFFKDSKVRDKNGNLLKVYHGTNQGNFSMFDWDKTQRADGGFYGRGHYFTAYRSMAEHYGARVVEGYLNIKNPFIWQDEVDGYKEFATTDVLTKNFAKRINMARLFPKLFANKTMNYGVFDNRTGEMTEKSIKWSDLEREITKTMGTLKPMIFAGGAVQWSYPGDFWDHQIGDRYESMEEAEKHKFEAAAKAFVETHTGIARYMTYDDQTTWTQDFGSEISDALMSMGYDGAMQNRDGEEIVAFRSNQFKNADNTNPTADPDIRYSDRGSESVSNRALLANAFEGIAQNEAERNRLQEYREKIGRIEAEERTLAKLNRKIRELSFAEGPKNHDAISEMRERAKKIAARIDTYDKQLLKLEASKPLRDILAREKQKAFQRAEKRSREAVADYRKRSAEGREKTAMRHKVQNVVGELNKLLLSNDKKHHVPDSMKKAVANALSLVNMDTVGAEERAARYAALIEQETDPDKIDAYTVSMENILRQGEKLGQYLKDLRNAYDEIAESADPDIANAYDPVIAGAMRELSQSIGNTSLRDMTIDQLSDVYDMYRMVLIRVRDANKSFLNEKKESISQLATQVANEVREVGGENTYRVSALDPARKFLWNNMKPVYAMETIGSATLTDAFNKVRAGEDVWAQDVTDGRAYFLAKSKKYGYDGWDFKKKHGFVSNSGLAFELTLEQILSLYAYSKREQAHEHLRLGGFVFDSNIETYKDGKLIKYKVNTADAHQITPEILADIIGTLSAEQRGFVDEMQDYLSTTMGAKGNEVTMRLYGIKLFKEKNYFPLKSAKQFLFEQNEVSGEVRIKNSGFTNKVVTKANNPVILSNFMEVWSGHVNDMSMYHAFVLPLEDFNRIFNYNSPKQEGVAPVSVKGTIQSAYSPAAVSYVKNLITDLNGGARTDSTTGVINKMMGLFKKGSVFASLSVVVQQPSAVARAAALVDTKYFIGPKVDAKRHKLLWAEVKKYAPVAIIKEMGYFDTNMGKSTQDFILAREYSGIREKMKALVTDSGYRDEVLSKAPALADEMAWCSIWEAVKREIQAKHGGMDVKSEAFLQLAGQRFTEVITKTQVYDSVLSRSANMRSKDTGMKMATAFMAEPTTSINMVADALLQGKRGNRKYARKAIGAVIASQIFNSILVSFVYAARDDDEDKTYAEKYIGALTGEILDSLNPAGYIPFIKDIVSIVQGYDVERSDMAVISDMWNAWQKLDSKNLSVYRKVEGFAGSIAQIFGLPLKNIMRDVRGIYQTIDSFLKGGNTTAAGLGYAAKESLPKWMGGGATSNQNQLYEAYLSGDEAQIARVEARYEDQSAINSAIRKALRENDPRIKQAAQAKFNGDLDEYMRLAKEILSEKHFSQENVVAAINAEINLLDKEESTTSAAQKVSGMFKADDFAVAVVQNDMAMANAIREDIIRTAQANGKSELEAEKDFNSSASASFKEQFQDGHITAEQAVKALVDFCGCTQAKAEERVEEWEFQNEYGSSYDNLKQMFLNGEMDASDVISNIMEVEGKSREEAYARIVSYSRDAYENGYFTRDEAASAMVSYGGMTESEAESKLRYIDIKTRFPDTYVDDSWVDKYYSEVESSGISLEIYVDYRNQVKGIDGTGKKERRMAVIDSLPITDEQKDALYYAEGWASSRIWQAPWH